MNSDEEEEEHSSSNEEFTNTDRNYTVKDLLKQAFKCLDSFKPDLAAKFFDKALELEPDNVDILDEYADLLLANGNVVKASRMLQKSIKLAPEKSYSKYMNLGQLLEGLEAVECFQKGVEIMQKELDGAAGDEESKAILRRELSAGHVVIAELWMTDLCYEENAEPNCVKYAKLALDTDPTNAEAYHTMASLLISQQLPPQALEVLTQGYNLWKSADVDGDDADGEGDVQMQEGDDNEGEKDMPSYASRLAAGKMFVELNEPETAMDIFNDLILENEDDPENYFLIALSTDDMEERKTMLAMAKEKIEKGEKEGETDLEHLKKAVLNAIANNNA